MRISDGKFCTYLYKSQSQRTAKEHLGIISGSKCFLKRRGEKDRCWLNPSADLKIMESDAFLKNMESHEIFGISLFSENLGIPRFSETLSFINVQYPCYYAKCFYVKRNFKKKVEV